MTDTPIEPALTAEEWAEVGSSPWIGCSYDEGIMAWPERPHVRSADSGLDIDDDMHALIALANAALPDFDPRKITREKIEVARHIMARAERRTMVGVALFAATDDLLDALESYLPPE